MRILDAAISAAHLSGIVVHGAAGVGKSRIAREALSAAESKGCVIRWAVGASSARELPLGALAAWASSTVAEPVQLVRGVIESLTSASPGDRVVVGVDDAHLLDDLSTFVIHQIVQRRAARVVLTVRDGEPISAGTQEIWKAGQFERLDLQPLSQDETTTLVSAVLGGTLDPAAAHQLWTLTRGNVLYLRNIVEREVEDGRLELRAGSWRWSGDPIVPPGLVETIESRIGLLPRAVGDVIDALAVCEPIELASLTRITDPVAVEDAESRGLIRIHRVDGGAEARVAHPLYAEVRRRRAAASRLRRLRGLVATELAASDRGDDIRIAVQRAALVIESDLDPEPGPLVRAAQGAVWLADLPLADRLAEVAIQAGGGPEAYFVRADVLSWLGRGREADAILVGMPTRDLTESDRARRTFLRAINLFWTLADPTGAKKLIDEATPTTPSSARGCIDAFLAEYWAAMGKPEAARKAAKNLALDQLPGIVAAVAAGAIVIAAGESGRTTEAVAAADAGTAIATRAFDAAHMRFGLADVHIGALLFSGRIGEASDAAERLRKQASDLPGIARVYSAAVAGRAALGAGRLDTACSLLEPVGQMLSPTGGNGGWVYRYQLPRIIALAVSGSTDDAVTALAVLEKHQYPGWGMVDYERELAKAWVAASQGAVSEAVASALSAGETAGANGQFAAEVMCLQTATQFGDHSGAARLRELAAVVEGPRVDLAARFAEALRAGDGAELAAVSEEFERMGDVVAAVDAAAHAAIAFRRQGLRGSGLGCATRAQALAHQCGDASTPALARAVERAPLTAREQEIVALIGEGLSNRALAERLNVSVRTIEGHIYRAMAKTGAADRDDLAALLPRYRRGSGD